MTQPTSSAADLHLQAHGELYALGFSVTGKLDEGSTPAAIGHAVRQRIEDLEIEGRRLRRILPLIAEHEGGVGALVEVYREASGVPGGPLFGVALCRADRDEVAFTHDVIEGIRELAAVLGGQLREGEPMERRGVTAGAEDAGEVSR